MINDIAVTAATEWAKAHSGAEQDPVKFGKQVASVLFACADAAASAIEKNPKSAVLTGMMYGCEACPLPLSSRKPFPSGGKQ